MKSRKWFSFIICSSIVLSNISNCEKDCIPPSGVEYEFEIPISIIPAKDTFHVGDTIKVISKFDSDVFERTTKKNFVLENWKLYPVSKIFKIDENPAYSALLDFNVVFSNNFDYDFFTYSNGDVDLTGEYSFQSGEYALEFYLVPLKAGLYHFRHLLAFNTYDPDQGFFGKCKNHHSDAIVFMNGGSDNNIGLLSDSPDPHYNDWILQRPEDRFHKFGGYCFYVVE